MERQAGRRRVRVARRHRRVRRQPPSAATASLWVGAQLMSDLKNAFENLPTSPRMPTLFIGHGNPMNAIEDNTYARSWKALGEELPTPTAILCVSAHWMTRGSTLVHIGPHPKTI